MDAKTLHVQNLRPSTMKSSLFSIIILARWDNVMGPMITKIWKGNDNVENNEEVVNYISNHTLSGELCRQTEKHTIDPKLCILPALGYLFNAYIFNGHSTMGSTITSLSFVMSYTDLNRYMLLQSFMEKQVKLIVLKYRVFQQKDIRSSTRSLSPLLKKFIGVVDTLADYSIPNHICVQNTIFGEIQTAHAAQLLDSTFLMKALTSHLQTHGCTVIVGKSASKINLLIDALSLFQSDKERYCSRLASDQCKEKFAQDLWIQGLIYDDELTVKILDSKDVMLNTHPVTMIDVEGKLVKQSVCSNLHAIRRRDNLSNEAAVLLHGQDTPLYPLSKVFTDVFGDISMLVLNFIRELFAIPNNCNIRRNHIENFKQNLYRKAVALLSYVEDKSNSGHNKLNEVQLQQMKRDLSLATESDFRVILATAEKLRPGLTMFLVKALESEDNHYQAILEAI